MKGIEHTVHSFLASVGGGGDIEKFLATQVFLITISAVNQSFHLARHIVEIYRRGKDKLTRFEELIDGYFTSGNAQLHGTPSVAWCASQLCLSPNYFGDLIKKETGRTALDYIQQKTMDLAKDMLLQPDRSIGEIAYALGYQYPQYFSRAFKKAVGGTPQDYRRHPNRL